MPSASSKSAYVQGLKAGLPFVIVVIPFALLYGVVAIEAGLTLAQVMGFSALVIAGASQFAALQFMLEHAPLAVIIGSALAVNLRMAMYSASITPHLGAEPLWKRMVIAYFLVDQSYALALNRYETTPGMSVPEKTAYFFGAMTPICPLWYVFTWVGAVLGAQIPADYGLDFIVPIAFLAMVAPALRTKAHIAAAVASASLALALVWVPFNLGLLITAIIAMMIGAEIERRSA